MPLQRGLYYPFIHFNDPHWLKVAALYWDRIGRIVPDDYRESHESEVARGDSDLARTLAEEGDGSLIKSFSPENVLPPAGAAFREFVNINAADLAPIYGLQNAHLWPEDSYTAEHAPPGSRPQLSYVYVTKMDDALQQTLLDSGLAEPGRNGDPRWLGMHPKLADIYLMLLAELIASDRGYEPLAAETPYHLALTGSTTERLAKVLLPEAQLTQTPTARSDIPLSIATVAFECALPEDLDALTPDQICRIRREFPLDRAAFQAYAKQLAADAPTLASREAVDDYAMDAYRLRIKPELQRLEEALAAEKIATRIGVLTATVKFLGGVATLLTSAGLALGVANVLNDREKKKASQDPPVSYLLRVRDTAAHSAAHPVAEAFQRLFGRMRHSNDSPAA